MNYININDILKATSSVIRTPSLPLRVACKNYGVVLSSAGYVVGTIIIMALVQVIIDNFKNKKKKAEEKERALKEVIRQQQAIINKLKWKNDYNQQEIKNLKDTLEMLQDIIKRMNNDIEI